MFGISLILYISAILGVKIRSRHCVNMRINVGEKDDGGYVLRMNAEECKLSDSRVPASSRELLRCALPRYITCPWPCTGQVPVQYRTCHGPEKNMQEIDHVIRSFGTLFVRPHVLISWATSLPSWIVTRKPSLNSLLLAASLYWFDQLDQSSTHLNTMRSSSGCWTCKLRRKKCDEYHPVCHACEALSATCHNDQDNKPEWMDNGLKQQGVWTFDTQAQNRPPFAFVQTAGIRRCLCEHGAADQAPALWASRQPS